MSSLEADLAALTAAMDASMTGENRRRELASQTPGLGSPLPMEQPAAGPSVGKSGLDMPVIGEGYSVTAPDAVQHKAYGPDRPVYADPVVSGYGFQAGKSEPAIRVWAVQRSRPADGIAVISPPGRPGLWSRLLGRLRSR
jgi:hypothetical protein